MTHGAEKSYSIDMNGVEEIVYHKDQMRLNFNWEEIDNELIKREATIAVANGEYEDWGHAYESHWDMWEAGDLILTDSF